MRGREGPKKAEYVCATLPAQPATWISVSSTSGRPGSQGPSEKLRVETADRERASFPGSRGREGTEGAAALTVGAMLPGWLRGLRLPAQEVAQSGAPAAQGVIRRHEPGKQPQGSGSGRAVHPWGRVAVPLDCHSIWGPHLGVLTRCPWLCAQECPFAVLMLGNWKHWVRDKRLNPGSRSLA